MWDVVMCGKLDEGFKQRFAQSECRVREDLKAAGVHGAKVFNPATLDLEREPEWIVRQCVHAVFEARMVIMLEGWRECDRCVALRALAVCLGKSVGEE